MLADIKAAKQRHVSGLERGIKKAALHVAGRSLELVPVDMGNLRASQFVRFEKQGHLFSGMVGYSANYALYVHEIPFPYASHGFEYNIKHAEDIRKKRTYSYHGIRRQYRKRGPKQQWKFLERPFREDQDIIRKMIVEEVRS